MAHIGHPLIGDKRYGGLSLTRFPDLMSESTRPFRLIENDSTPPCRLGATSPLKDGGIDTATDTDTDTDTETGIPPHRGGTEGGAASAKAFVSDNLLHLTDVRLPYNPSFKDRAREMRKNMTLAEKIMWTEILP